MSDTQNAPVCAALRWTYNSFTIDMVHVIMASPMTWLFVAITPAVTSQHVATVPLGK